MLESDTMATKRGERSIYEMAGFRPNGENFERTVTPNDTLQGLALLYNTSVAELKKINHIHSDVELHARRVIKIPSKGILINLEESPPENAPLLQNSNDNDDEEETNGFAYLNNVDNVVKEIKEKAEQAAVNSTLLDTTANVNIQGSLSAKYDDLKWWKLLLPCVCILLFVPILYYLYLEHVHHLSE